MKKGPVHYTLIKGDFKAKVGKNSLSETTVENHTTDAQNKMHSLTKWSAENGYGNLPPSGVNNNRL